MLLLLDKDGTLVRPKSGAKFVNDPIDQEPLPGVVATLDAYCAAGWDLVIVSNQGGVAAGHKSSESVIAEMRFCLQLLPKIAIAYFCPDFEGERCFGVTQKEVRDFSNHKLTGAFRKPNPGMLELAIEMHGAPDGLMIGDGCARRPWRHRSEDEQAASAAKNVLFQWATDFFNQEGK